MPEPVTRCRCGYQLLKGQDCPECGRPFPTAPSSRPGHVIPLWFTVGSTMFAAAVFVVPFAIPLYRRWVGTGNSFLADVEMIFLTAIAWPGAAAVALLTGVFIRNRWVWRGPSFLLLACAFINAFIGAVTLLATMFVLVAIIYSTP